MNSNGLFYNYSRDSVLKFYLVIKQNVQFHCSIHDYDISYVYDIVLMIMTLVAVKIFKKTGERMY